MLQRLAGIKVKIDIFFRCYLFIAYRCYSMGWHQRKVKINNKRSKIMVLDATAIGCDFKFNNIFERVLKSPF